MNEVDPLGLQQFENSLGGELWHSLNLADEAHFQALRQTGLLSAQQIDSARKCLFLLFGTDGKIGTEFSGDIFDQRLAWLSTSGFQDLGWMNLGRARREAITVAFHLEIRTRLAEVLLKCLAFSRAQVVRALENLDSVIPDYTYLAPSQPTSWAHLIHGHIGALLRTVSRGQELLVRLDVSPAGHGSTNGSRIPLNREFLAKRLGFNQVNANTRDSVLRPDVLLEIEHCVASAGLFLNRWSSEYLHFLSPQLGYFRLGDRTVRSSLILPQKRNPYRLSLLRGISVRLLGRANDLGALVAGLSHQPEQRMLSYAQNFESLRLWMGAMSEAQEISEDIEYVPEISRRECLEHSVLATEIAECLAEKGIDYRMAARWIQSAFAEHFLWADAMRALEVNALAAGVQIKLEPDPEKFLQESIGSRKQLGSSQQEGLAEQLTSLDGEIAKRSNQLQDQIRHWKKSATEQEKEMRSEF